MPVISTDSQLNERIGVVCNRLGEFFDPVFFEEEGAFLEFLRYELPEVNIINFSDQRVDTERIQASMAADPWLHYGSIIGVCRRTDEKAVSERLAGSNVITLIPRPEFVRTFARVLRILIQNRQILYQRDLQNYLIRHISGSFVMDNDPFNVKTYANLVANYLYNSNFVDEDGRDRLHAALFELLMNAVEHGNCGISYAEKSRWLESGGDILELIRSRTSDPGIRRKRVHLSYRIDDRKAVFTIRDDGEGFDWRATIVEDGGPNMALHGNGIRMARLYVYNLRYNEAGNEVTFEFPHTASQANVVPGIFSDQPETRFGKEEIVFQEGEESDYLYYIVAGRFGIYSNGRHISTLSPDDLFLGEMSFLLNNRRSATVVSQDEGTLIRISKHDFMNVIKHNPHYGIFLARLLAQRLSKLNEEVAKARPSANLAPVLQ